MDASLSHGLEKLAEKLVTIVNQIQFLSDLSESEKTLVDKLVSRVQKIFSTCQANRVKLEEIVLIARSHGTPTQIEDEAMMCSLLAGQGEEVIEVVNLIIRVISSMFPERRIGLVTENTSVLSQRSEFLRCEKLMADALQAQSEANELARTARHNATVAEFKTRLNNQKSPPPPPNPRQLKTKQSIDEDTVKVSNSIETTPAPAGNSEYTYAPNNEHSLKEQSYQSPPSPRQVERTREVTKSPPAQKRQSLTEINTPTENGKTDKSCCSGTVIFICLLILLLAAGGGAAVYFFVLK